MCFEYSNNSNNRRNKEEILKYNDININDILNYYDIINYILYLLIIEKSNNLTFVIVIFEISNFRNIGRSTF